MEDRNWRIRKISSNVYEPDKDLDFGPFPTADSAAEERDRLMQTPEFKNATLRIIPDPRMPHWYTNMEGV